MSELVQSVLFCMQPDLCGKHFAVSSLWNEAIATRQSIAERDGPAVSKYADAGTFRYRNGTGSVAPAGTSD